MSVIKKWKKALAENYVSFELKERGCKVKVTYKEDKYFDHQIIRDVIALGPPKKPISLRKLKNGFVEHAPKNRDAALKLLSLKIKIILDPSKENEEEYANYQKSISHLYPNRKTNGKTRKKES